MHATRTSEETLLRTILSDAVRETGITEVCISPSDKCGARIYFMWHGEEIAPYKSKSDVFEPLRSIIRSLAPNGYFEYEFRGKTYEFSVTEHDDREIRVSISRFDPFDPRTWSQ